MERDKEGGVKDGRWIAFGQRRRVTVVSGAALGFGPN